MNLRIITPIVAASAFAIFTLPALKLQGDDQPQPIEKASIEEELKILRKKLFSERWALNSGRLHPGGLASEEYKEFLQFKNLTPKESHELVKKMANDEFSFYFGILGKYLSDIEAELVELKREASE